MAALSLPDALEAELAAVREDPKRAIGWGDKTYTPYEPSGVHFLMTSRDPAVTRRLVAEMDGADRVLRLALLHVLGKRRDEQVDGVLLDALEDPELSATAAYLLGRVGFKGYPSRSRDEEAVRAALLRHVGDDATFDDPFYKRSFRAGDFALAALARLDGWKGFEDTIGLTLPRFDDVTREALLARSRGGS